VSHHKRTRSGQDRHGNPRTRTREYDTILYHVRKNKERFIRRLQGLVREDANGCVLHKGSIDHYGYPRMNFRDRRGRHITIHACRVFLILMLARAIKLGHEAGHTCHNRRCVRHLTELPYDVNARTNGAHADIPF
jgi:hypothetical protein